MHDGHAYILVTSPEQAMSLPRDPHRRQALVGALAFAGLSGLRPLLGMVLLAAGMGLLTKAGISLSPVLILAAPVALGLLAWYMHNRREAALVTEGAG